MHRETTGIIILAAGASTRLGQPKQKLLYQGKSLLQHAIQVAQETNCGPVVVVLGANAEIIQAEIPTAGLQVAFNLEWPEGMASSIRCGLSALIQRVPALSNVILMVCDQPFVSAFLLNQLIEKKGKSGEAIVAAAYQDTLGTPVLFPKKYFPELHQLQGQEGAKKLLYLHAQAVISIPFPQGTIDIDTSQDYQNLQQHTTS